MLPEIPNIFNVYSIQKNFHPIEDTYIVRNWYRYLSRTLLNENLA